MSWPLLALISAVAAGVTSVFAKAGLNEVPSHLANAARTAIVLALCLIALWWSGEHQRTSQLTPRAWLLLGLSGLATAVSWIAYFKALSIGSATAVTSIDKASLAVTMVLAMMFLGERPSWTSGLGVALIVLGSLLASVAPR